jgi:hypothetical protein
MSWLFHRQTNPEQKVYRQTRQKYIMDLVGHDKSDARR